MLCVRAGTTYLVILALTRPGTAAPRTAAGPPCATSKQAPARGPYALGRWRTNKVRERACAPSARASAAVRRRCTATVGNGGGWGPTVHRKGGSGAIERLQIDVRFIVVVVVATIVRVGIGECGEIMGEGCVVVVVVSCGGAICGVGGT